MVGYNYQLAPAPPQTGGVLADGTYDLVQMIRHGRATGEWSSNNAPAIRMVFRITAEERSVSLVQGNVAALVEIAPASTCGKQRFATVGNDLRVTGREKLDSVPFSATADGLVFVKNEVSYVFRRRR